MPEEKYSCLCFQLARPEFEPGMTGLEVRPLIVNQPPKFMLTDSESKSKKKLEEETKDLSRGRQRVTFTWQAINLQGQFKKHIFKLA